MKNVYKTLLFAIIIAVLAFSLVMLGSCGEEDVFDDGTSTETPQDEPQKETPDAPIDNPTNEGGKDDPIKPIDDPEKEPDEPAPIELTIKIDNKSSAYGSDLKELTYKVVSGEAAEGDDLGIALKKDGTSDVGEYAIKGTASNKKYKVTFINGTYTITPKNVNIIWEDVFLPGGGRGIPKAYFYDVNSNKQYLDVTVASYKIDEESTIEADITDYENYNFSNITKEILLSDVVSIVWENIENVTYDGEDHKPNAYYFDIFGNKIDLTNYLAAKTDADEYTYKLSEFYPGFDYNVVDGSDSQAFTILPKEADVIWENLEFTYDGKAQKPTATFVDVNGVTISLEVNGEKTDAGEDYTAVAKMDDPNYTLASASSKCNFTILPKEVEVTWGETTFTYDGEAQNPTAYFIDVNGTKQTLTVNGSCIDVGTYDATATTTDTNYALTNDTTTFTITAPEVKYSEGLAYTLSSDKTYYSVTGIGTCTDTDIVIPPTYNSLPVKAIGNRAFYDKTTITSITIPSGVKSIGDYAFYWCSSLTSITIPSGVESIGERAFYWCSSLTSITFEEGSVLKSMGDHAFYNCSSLTSITIPSGVESIGDYAFYWCSSLTSITFEEGSALKSIGERAFSYCSSLKSITIPSGVESIGDSAFRSCSSLTSITIPSGVESIGDYAFYWCSSLTSITIPSGVESIGEYAFYWCSSLTSITFEEGSALKSIGYKAFYNCSSLKSIKIPSGVESIGEGVFADCGIKSIDGIVLEEGNKYYHIVGNCLIGTESKILIKGFNNSTMPSDGSVTRIGDSAFRDCSKLTSITIPSGVESIGSYAFAGDFQPMKLTSITFEEGSALKSIGEWAFYNCSSLTSITIPNSAKSIGRCAFYGTQCIENEEGISYVDKWVVDCDTSISTAKIREDTVGIADYAFEDCSSLTSITIPSGVESIGECAFRYCYKLIEVCNLSSSITIEKGSEDNGYIGYYAKDINTSKDYISKLSIDAEGYIIYTDDGEKILMGYTGDKAELTLQSDITEIYRYAFYKCYSLTSITIPSGVESIGDHAFEYCSSLTSITFEDTSNWYKTYNETNWQNKRNGSLVDASELSNASTNASNFRSNYSYYGYYWYKKSK